MQVQTSQEWHESEIGKMEDDMGLQMSFLQRKMELKEKLDNGTISKEEKEALYMLEHMMEMHVSSPH